MAIGLLTLLIASGAAASGVHVSSAPLAAHLPTVSRAPRPQAASYGAVNGTEVLANASYFPGNFIADQAPGDYSPAYDASNGDIYLADSGTDNVSVVSTASNKVVDNIPTPTFSFADTAPSGIALDTTNGDLYVTLDSGLEDVLVVDPANQSVIGRIPVPWDATAIAYDAVDGQIFVAGTPTGSTGALVAINPTTEKVLATDVVGNDPVSITVDSTSGNLIVVNQESTNLSMVSGSTDAVTGTITLPPQLVFGTNTTVYPAQACFDAALNEYYLADGLYSGNVTVLDATTGALVTNITTGSTGEGPIGTDPEWAVCDPTNHEVYVADSLLNEVVEIDPATNTVVGNVSVAYAPTTLTLASGTNQLYTTNSYGNMTVISPTTLAVTGGLLLSTYPFWLSVDSTSGEVFTSTSEDGVEAVQAFNPITHAVTTFPTIVGAAGPTIYDPASGEVVVSTYLLETLVNTQAGVTFINPASDTIGATVNLSAGVNGFAYDSANHLVYATLAQGYSNLIGINSAGAIVSTASLGSSTGVLLFDPVNDDLYIGTGYGSTENLTVFDPTTASVVANISMGDLPEGLTFDPHNQEVFASGLFLTTTTEGLAVVNTTTNTIVGSVSTGYGPVAYDSQTGDVYVTDGGNNGVDVVNATTDAVLGTITVGVAPWGIATSVNGTSIYVANEGGASVSVLGAKAQPTYDLTFEQSTLPTGTSWSVTLNGTVHSSTSGAISFTEPAGKYSYTVTPISGYTASPRSGNETLSTGDLTVTITFTANATVALTSVSVTPATQALQRNGTVVLTAIPTCTDPCPSGIAYVWTFSPALGTLNVTSGTVVKFTAGVETGTVTVTVNATFGSVTKQAEAVLTISGSGSGGNGSTPSGGGSLLLYGAIIVILIVVVVAVVLLLKAKGRRGPGSAPPTAPSPPTVAVQVAPPPPPTPPPPTGTPAAPPPPPA